MALNENAKKWVEALRSGEFKQAQKALQTETGYCCLGVACRVYETKTGRRFGSLMGMPTLIHFPEVRAWLGLKEHDGAYDDSSLAKENDQGASFHDIANIIESEPEGLFKS